MSQTLFTVQTPAGEFHEGSPITVSTTVVFAQAGTVSGGRFYSRSTNPGGSYQLVLFLPTVEDGGPGQGDVLATATYPSITNGAWNEILFITPVAVQANVAYKIGLRSSQGAYTATSHFFETSALVNGDITGPQTGTFIAPLGTVFNGSYRTDLTGYPNQTFEGAGYFVDVLYDPAPVGPVDIAATLTATGSLTAALNADTTVGASLAVSGSLSVDLTTPTVGPVDPIAAPVAAELLACFTEKLQTLVDPPAFIQMRVGQETGPLIGPGVDECCAGLAWVRVVEVYPSWDSFPQADNTWLPCGPLAYAVVLEMGMAFCMPWSDSDGSFENVDPPSTADWATAHATQMRDQTLMRQTAACCFRPTQRRAVGSWTSLPVEGGCTGGKLTVTVSVPAPCSDC